jgi:hypothetical protein
MDGIWRYIKLILDPASKVEFEKEAQDALDTGTDPKQAEENLKKVEGGFGALGSAAKKLGGVLAGLFAAGKILEQTVNAEREFAQLRATVESTGGAAGFTAQQLSDMADQMSRASIFGGGDVMNAQVRLLTYTNVQGESFRRATQAAMDMATALRTDVASAAEVIGRALQDPLAATAALSRQGFKFTEEQKEMMKQMLEVGDVAGAQGIIFQELELAYGGSAEAARNTLGGALAALAEQWNQQITLSSQATSGVVGFINDVSDALPRLRSQLDQSISSLEVFWIRVSTLREAFQLGLYRDILRMSGPMVEGLERAVEEANRRIAEIELAPRMRAINRLVAGAQHAGDRPEPSVEIAAAREEETKTVDKQRQAVDALIASLNKERDALLYSERLLLQRSDAFKNATAAEQQMMLQLFDQTEALKAYDRQLEEANKEKERLDGLTRSLVESLQDELDKLLLTEGQIRRNTDAYRNASMAQQMQIAAIESLIDAENALAVARDEQVRKQYELEMQVATSVQNMADAFTPFFEQLILGFQDTDTYFKGLAESAKGVGIAIVSELVKGMAEYHMAKAIGALADGTWPPNPAALAAAAKHTAAAAAFKAIPGVLSGLGSGGGAPSQRPPGSQPSEIDRFGPDIQIYVDGVDPKNPRHQALIGETARKYTGRTSGRVEYR